MSEQNGSDAGYVTAAGPNPALRSLDKLVGRWQISGRESGPQGEIYGQVCYEWLPGGYYLLQHVDIQHIDHEVKGIEVIGYERNWDGLTGTDCTSHFFGNNGESFQYVYDADETTLTIWGGQRGSPAFFKGTFSPDGKSLRGAWQWPGGGYEANLTRVD